MQNTGNQAGKACVTAPLRIQRAKIATETKQLSTQNGFTFTLNGKPITAIESGTQVKLSVRSGVPLYLNGAIVGVAAIGFVNLSVSFALALNIALRSRQVSDTPWRMIAGAVLKCLWRNPREFFLPPKKTGSGA